MTYEGVKRGERDRVPGARRGPTVSCGPTLGSACPSPGGTPDTRPQRSMGQPAKVAAFSDRHGYDREHRLTAYYIGRFQSERAERIRGNVLEVKDASYARRFGAEVHPFVVDIDSGNPEADLHVDLNVPRSLPAESFNRVILTQVLQFLHPRRRLPTCGHRSPLAGRYCLASPRWIASTRTTTPSTSGGAPPMDWLSCSAERRYGGSSLATATC